MLTSSVFGVFDIVNNSSILTSLSQEDFPLAKMPNIPDWLLDGLPYNPWLFSVLASICVGLTGVIPMFFINADPKNKEGPILKSVLGFAVGALLGDVFLHSLPEIYSNSSTASPNEPSSGAYVLLGLITFIALEKLLSTKIEEKEVAGYLNLLANSIDNFTHGLSVGGAFLVSTRLGITTTLAILCHEIPHEFSDFGIILNAGFSRYKAAALQLTTAGGGLMGALFALICSGSANSIEARTSWILPFTAGSFLHIALVTILPDLLDEQDPKESFKQMVWLLAGIMLVSMLDGFVH